MPLRALLGLVAVSFLLPAPSLAWDETAHRAIARIAEEHISASALRRYRYYVPSGQELEDVSYWAQSLFQERPETEAWHSITLPPDATAVDLQRDCPLGDCITVKIREAEGIVRLAHKPRAVVSDYVRFLVHLAGDLHQPLNAGYPPGEGVSDPPVVYQGVEMPLSKFWDDHLFEGVSVDELADRIRRRITPSKLREWQTGTLKDWTWDTHLVAVRVAYGSLPAGTPRQLDAEYVATARSAAEEQLAKAAVRLAVSLDRVWP
ncbi:MAG: S1/P1 nuclease [Acidobacteria bacterium]|nr:S1/P1 nuclease [Acidobacteriota bacterium]MDA1234096.1 S1/P1 nuclease [Acidobacteriota bacterium]